MIDLKTLTDDALVAEYGRLMLEAQKLPRGYCPQLLPAYEEIQRRRQRSTVAVPRSAVND